MKTREVETHNLIRSFNKTSSSGWNASSIDVRRAMTFCCIEENIVWVSLSRSCRDLRLSRSEKYCSIHHLCKLDNLVLWTWDIFDFIWHELLCAHGFDRNFHIHRSDPSDTNSSILNMTTGLLKLARTKSVIQSRY